MTHPSQTQSFLRAALIGILAGTLLGSTTGCTVSQSKINTVVQDIETWAPVVASDASALLTDIASFDAADAGQIQGFVAVLNTDSAALATACRQYLAAPSATLLTEIAGLVGQLATSDAGALLAVAEIKNANSQMIARGVLTTVATAVTILSAYLQSVNVQPTNPVALEQLKPYANRATLALALARAQDQDLAPRQATLATFGF